MPQFFRAIALTSTLLLAQACNSSVAPENTSQTPTSATSVSNRSSSHGGHNSSTEHNMDLGPADAEFDLRFIDGMTPHHQGALEMAKAAQQNSKRSEIKQLADDIIKAQNKEIEQMKKWRQAWYPKAGNNLVAYHAAMNHTMAMSPQQIKSMKMSRDLGAGDAEFDLRFLNAMIPHHEAALVMARDAIQKTEKPEIKQLSQEILTSQQKEIDRMKQWRQAWYKQ